MKTLNKKAASFFLMISLVVSLAANSVRNASAPISSSFTDKNAHDLFLRLAPYAGAMLNLALCVATSNPKEQNEWIKQLKPKNLAINVAQEYVHHVAALLFHELGHALAAKFLNNDEINIHVGSADTKSKSLFSLGGLHVDGFWPTSGYSLFTAPHCTSDGQPITDAQKMLEVTIQEYCKNQHLILANLKDDEWELLQQKFQHKDSRQEILDLVPYDRTRLAIILLAGSIAGLIGSASFKALRHHFVSSPAKGSLKDTLFSIEPADLGQLQNLLLPTSPSSDAYCLYEKCLGINSIYLQHGAVLSPIIMFIAHVVLAYKKAGKKVDNQTLRSWAHAFQVALTNYPLQGFAQFK